MSALAALLLLLSMVGAVVGLLMLVPRRFRRRGFYLTAISAVAFVGAALMGSSEINREARDLGFESAADRRASLAAGVDDAAVWEEVKSAGAQEPAAAVEPDHELIADNEIAADNLEEAVADETAGLVEEDDEKDGCKADLGCWAERHLAAANTACSFAIERLARFDYEWTNGFLEMKFGRYRWSNIDAGHLTYVGDRIKLQNGFGAWQHHIYFCDYDPISETVIHAEVRPGRL